MNCENYFKDIFESNPEFRKKVLLRFLIRNEKNTIHEIGFSERHINCLNLEF